MEQNNKDRKPAENLISGIIFRLHDSPAASQHFLPEDAFFFFEDIKKVSSSLSSMHHKEKRNLYFDMGLHNSCAGRAFSLTMGLNLIHKSFSGREKHAAQNSLPMNLLGETHSKDRICYQNYIQTFTEFCFQSMMI